MIKRIIDRQTKLFIRDDFYYDETTESAIETPCPAGFFHPRWNGTEWVEGLTQEEIQAIIDNATPTKPTLEERLDNVETDVVEVREVIDTLFGGAV